MPSTGNAAWDVVVAVVALLGSVAGIGVVLKGGQRTDRDANKARASPLPPSWREMWDEMRKLRDDNDALRNDHNALRTDHLDLKSRMGVVEQDRDALGDGLRVIAEWDDAGRPDPPGFPGIAAHARHVLDRLHSH